jgi:hypothetical protein
MTVRKRNKLARKRRERLVIGYAAVVVFADGRLHEPVARNYLTKELARKAAQQWIDTNHPPARAIAVKATNAH